MKRLYVVRVEFEYAALAESEREAERHADQAARDLCGMWCDSASASLVNFYRFPGRLTPIAAPPDGRDRQEGIRR